MATMHSFTGFWEALLAPIVVLALVAATLGFLLLVSRVSWAARELVLACREGRRAHRELIGLLQDEIESRDPGLDERLWSASVALGSC
jgi:hypothetical protein